MTVDDLRKALEGIPGNRKVLVAVEDDEFYATCVTDSASCLRICKTSTEVSGPETVLYVDLPEGA